MAAISMLTEQLLTVCGGCYVNAGFTTSLLCVMAAMSMLAERLLTVCDGCYVNAD